MKSTFISLCVALVFAACTSVAPLQSMETSIRIRVECRDDPSTRRMVTMLLKQARARDITEQADIHFMVIEASYYEADNSMRKLQGIVDQLTQSAGVVKADMQWNPGVVKQNR
ncbi:MAG: hypothetical protein JST68_27125 [Bacteroidetes bacterium]|nr:hypothetical protein [Bacteroidota bacterium]